MNSRERVLTALRFEEPDRVPVDLGGTTGASGIHVVAYDRLKKLLGLKGPTHCNDVMQQLAEVEEEVRRRIGADVIRLSPIMFCDGWDHIPLFPDSEVLYPRGMDIHKENDGSWLLRNAAGAVFNMPPGSNYFDAADGVSWYSWNVELTDEILGRLSAKVKHLYESTDYALTAAFGGSFTSSSPEFLMNLVLEPEQSDESLGRTCDALIKKYSLLHEAIGDRAFCVTLADDFGSQNAPMMSPETFRERIVPHYRRFSEWLHATTNWKLYLHSCGAIEPLIEDIIGMGVDILNPIQTSAAGMDPELLKRKYGRRIVFWGGGCDTQRVLGFKSPEEIRRHVQERIRILAPGGGFVFNQVHAIQPTVVPEDILAVFDTVREFGTYPIGNT